MHTIKLQVDDTIYNEIVKSGINIQDELKKIFIGYYTLLSLFIQVVF